jgi:hypothetical protein
MKIASATLELEASHSKLQRHEIRESMLTWVGEQRPESDGRRPTRALAPETVQISDAGRAAQTNEASAIKQSLEAAEHDPMLLLLRAMIAALTGHEARVFDAGELTDTGTSVPALTIPGRAMPEQAASQQASMGFGVEYEYHESYTESEQMDFAASGVVQTTDGKTISFDLALSMSRYYHEESNVSIRLGDARQTKDPLVLNFEGTAAQLTSQRFAFDLDADGQTDSINFVAGGSGFLALDRNSDGAINDGSELFGAKSGDGFAELAAFDADKNGWIDENDAVYEQLRVWTKDSAGNDQLATLKEANVGAISLARVATPFDIKDAANSLQGQIRSSGIFLQEDGGVGTIQQIDLTV